MLKGSKIDPTTCDKKRKVSEEFQDSRHKKLFAQSEDQIMHLSLFSIVADEYREPIKTEKYFIGKINSKKETSRLIRELSSAFPLQDKSHLKRVRWTDQKDIFEIIIRPLTSCEIPEKVSSFSISDVLENSKINTSGLMDSVFVHDIPKNQTKTYKQFKEASKFWPVQFREDEYIEKLLKDELFSRKEKMEILKYMELCDNAAKYGDEKVGCVVVDPISSKVIAIAHDLRHHHPVQHAVMVAADLVAKSQGGGSWEIKSEHIFHIPFLQEEVNKKIEMLSELYPDKDVRKKALPYLCTGYDLYVSREPCVMCAMSLVHSRIRRVFYKTATPWGALGSHWKLHLQDGLNHHYEVFKLILDEENLNNLT